MTRVSPRNPKFTFKYFREISDPHMGICFSCDEVKPNSLAWEQIDRALFFDIKLNPEISMKEYSPVLNKINTVTKRDDVIPVLHFSNDLADKLSKEHMTRFWDCMSLITHNNYELQFEHKISTIVKDTFVVHEEFFDEIIEYLDKNMVQHCKLSVLDKDDSEFLYKKT